MHSLLTSDNLLLRELLNNVEKNTIIISYSDRKNLIQIGQKLKMRSYLMSTKIKVQNGKLFPKAFPQSKISLT